MEKSVKGSSKLGQYYVLITPIKNEGENLPELVQSIVKQTIKPVLWVIMDDGSTDNTPEILKEVRERYDWIQGIRFDSEKRDLGLHLSHVIKSGFDFAIEYCMKRGIDYDYFGNVDGDMILEPTFFETLIKEFENNLNLGIASGGIKRIIGSSVVYLRGQEDEPSGGNMLIRRKCFEYCGGIPVSYSWDSVLNVKARLKGWKTKRFEENIVIETRDVFSANGYWNGYLQFGKSAYYRNFNPIYIIVKSILYLLKKPYYIGITYLLGYFGDFIRRREKIEDDEIRKYYWNKWKEYL